MNIKDFLDFVDFLKNVDMYEKRVHVLRDENERLETNIKLTAEIADIPRTRQVTEQLLAEAREAAEAAKKEASEIKERAKTLYDKRIAEVTVRESEAVTKYEKGKEALKEAENLNATLNAQLRRQLSDLEISQAKLQVTQSEMEERLSKLKSVMG